MRRYILPPLLAIMLVSSVARAEVHELTVPLHDGRLHSDDLMISVLEKCHLPGIGWGSYTVNLSALQGSDFVNAFNESLGKGAHIDVDQKALTLSVDPQQLPRSTDRFKHAVEVFTADIAPVATAQQRRSWGLSLPKQLDENRRLVILIHGLDCNRSNWGEMADLLDEAGYQVAYFCYPSDGPIEDSVALLAKAMTGFRHDHPGISVSILAHSMGGLVARGYVESPQYAGNIDQLIMLGTPNQGSKWAGYRIPLEIREHYGLWKSDPNWHLSWMITDGLGEAGRDLKPSSAFLTELNSRPRRAGVRYTIIAGDQNLARRVEADTLECTANIIPRRAQSWWGLRQINSGLHRAADSVRETRCKSDGPVTLKSTRLQGVDDFVVLHADHNALYIGIDGKPPLAWPTIRERLAMAH